MSVQIISDGNKFLRNENKLSSLAMEMNSLREENETMTTKWGEETFTAVVSDLREKKTRKQAEPA